MRTGFSLRDRSALRFHIALAIASKNLHSAKPDVYTPLLFDFGSGACLWSANDPALTRFDYPVLSDKLPICSTLKCRVEFVLAWHDTFLDWDNPPSKTQWAAIEKEPFCRAAQELLYLLREQLGSEFEILDESRTAA